MNGFLQQSLVLLHKINVLLKSLAQVWIGYPIALSFQNPFFVI
jgi:hypothetical protein